AYAKEHGVYVSLNLLLFPGLNDRPEEIDGWRDFLRETGIDMIQLRNLNIDPDYFLPKMPAEKAKPIGVKGFLKFLAEEFPDIRVGSFSRYVKKSDA
ncbi:MAG: radical SAM protein, partial [Selenomonadales bacterium]|nr:radical SAM protein [Selenomonadales bacterium]